MHWLLRFSLCIALIAFRGAAVHGQEGSKNAPSAQAATAAESTAEPPATRDAPAVDPKAADPEPAAAKTETAGDGKLTFNFRYQPWQDVLDWFADQAGLSLLIESPPSGTFNYRDTRSYTPTEALDVLNGVLLTKGYTLVRRDRMLVLVNLEDGVPPNLVPDVSLEELDERGEYELIRVLFPVWNMSPDQAAEEVQPILGPQGKVVTLPQARQIQVTETAGRLRTIRSIVHAIEQPDLGTAGVREFKLKHVTFDGAMPTIRHILGIPAEAYSTPDGAMQITRGAIGEKILFRGTAQDAARLQEILRLVDVPEAAPGINGAPQLEVYPITTADPEAVLKVLEQLMRDDPNVTLAADKDAGHIVVVAAPKQQATIRAIIDQMQKESREVDVIALANTDPQVAVLAINKLFGSVTDKPDPKAPRVDADLNSRSLLVRGTTAQVEQIRDLLRQLGETEEGTAARDSSQQHLRLLPLTGAAAKSAVEQIEQIWPSVRPNRIRILNPNATINTYRPSESSGGAEPVEQKSPAAAPTNDSAGQFQELLELLRDDNSLSKPAGRDDVPDGADNRKTIFRYAAEDGQTTPPTAEPNPQPIATSPSPQPPTPSAPTKRTNPGKGAPVVVAPGPGGLLIASDDLEALDELEELLTAVAGRSASSAREYSVFYLKYSKAATIAEVLASIFGGSTGSNDKGLIGDMASNALGDVGGALMGDLLLGGGGGGSSFSSANVEIVPDARLNAIIVYAKPADRDTIYQLLQVLDQRTGPEEVEADGQPRSIPVYNASASDIAQTIQQLYQDRIAGSNAAPSPQEMMKLLRGGPNTEQQIQKMSIAVDTRNNMLIVRAPDPLFDEIKLLVTELDEMEADSPETTRVVSLKHTNSAAVQKALTSILDNVKTSTTTAQVAPTPTPTAQRGNDDNDDDSPEERARRAMRRNWEMMQEMRRAQERMGGDRGGGGDRSRFFGGRGGPGGGEGDRGGGDGDRGRGGDGDRRGRD